MAEADQQAVSAQPEDPSVVSLVSDYDISVEQARIQMDIQVAAGRAAQDLPQDLQEIYSGRQIHHDKGGAVTVGVSDESRGDEIRKHFASHGVNPRVVTFRVTQADLEARIEEAQAQLLASRGRGERPQVAVSQRSLGKITVRTTRGGAPNGSEAALLATAKASPHLYDIEDVDVIPISDEEACDFSGDIECDPPLHGSVMISNAGSGICSAGFVARSYTDDKPYVLTAGHCHTNSNNWYTQFADDSSHAIGPFHRSQNDAETDVGILRVNNPTGWQFGWPLITVDPTGGHSANENYVLEGVLEPGLGDRVCSTMGNSARTDCGTVTDTSVTGGGTAGLFEVDQLCTNGGDSGSPYFSNHIAYGVHSAGDGVSGSSGCLFGRAEHMGEAQQRMNVYILTF